MKDQEKKAVLLRLKKRIVVNEDGCWIWDGHTNRDGYGKCRVGVKSWLMHRLFYFLHRGEIGKGLTIDHLCRNRACCNPQHLEAVTLRENILRGNTLQAKNFAKTECLKGHKFDELNTYIRNGRRGCRACNLMAVAKYKQKKLIATHHLTQPEAGYNGNPQT